MSHNAYLSWPTTWQNDTPRVISLIIRTFAFSFPQENNLILTNVNTSNQIWLAVRQSDWERNECIYGRIEVIINKKNCKTWKNNLLKSLDMFNCWMFDLWSIFIAPLTMWLSATFFTQTSSPLNNPFVLFSTSVHCFSLACRHWQGLVGKLRRLVRSYRGHERLN